MLCRGKSIDCSEGKSIMSNESLTGLTELEGAMKKHNHVKYSVADVSYSKVDVPNHTSWIVTRWDFGVDGLITYTGLQFFFRWGSS